MSLSTHYYVLSLTTGTSLLFEAFRDSLIEIENQGFPFTPAPPAPDSPPHLRARNLGRAIGASFARRHARDPLRIVLVGERQMTAAFESATTSADAIIGHVDGDHTGTSFRDLGQIVWPIVKEALSGVTVTALRLLDAHAGRGEITSGLENVARHLGSRDRGTLLVEEDYHVRGSLGGTGRAPVVHEEIDIRDVLDDAVDAVAEKVLEAGGRVVFMPAGSLTSHRRIVFYLPDEEDSDRAPGAMT